MKLLLCKKCQDVIKLTYDERTCKCGSVGGKYVDNINVEYYGDLAVLLGFNNSSLRNAVINQPDNGMGKEFIAFVMPKKIKTAKKV